MRVLEIFNSIDGEGNRAGELATFIRLAGCNLKCPYCDTKYSWSGDAGEEMTDLQVVERVRAYGCRNVTVTGGEPLIHRGIKLLLRELVQAGFNVNVETNGSIPIEPVRDFVRPTVATLYFTVDYKCPSSGQEEAMHPNNFGRYLWASDVVKFVVGDENDLDTARMVTMSQLRHFRGDIYISPVFGSIEPAQIVDYMKKFRMQRWRLQLQMHKYIWDPEKRGV